MKLSQILIVFIEQYTNKQKHTNIFCGRRGRKIELWRFVELNILAKSSVFSWQIMLYNEAILQS